MDEPQTDDTAWKIHLALSRRQSVPTTWLMSNKPERRGASRLDLLAGLVSAHLAACGRVPSLYRLAREDEDGGGTPRR
jgi:hypothetical protein